MKKYTFELVVHEGNDEFWNSLENKSGCDAVTDAIKLTLADGGWFVGDGVELKLKKFEYT